MIGAVNAQFGKHKVSLGTERFLDQHRHQRRKTQDPAGQLTMGIGGRFFQRPCVKSGTSTEALLRAMDCSLSGPMTDQAAASYTSWSSGSPWRRQ